MQLNVDTVMLIIKIVCGTVTGISTILGILSAVLGGKWRGLYKNVKAVNEKTLKIIELIEEAESHQAYDGEDKLQFVLAKYLKWCSEQKIPYCEEDTITQINELIEMTNNVNKGIKTNARSREW